MKKKRNQHNPELCNSAEKEKKNCIKQREKGERRGGDGGKKVRYTKGRQVQRRFQEDETARNKAYETGTGRKTREEKKERQIEE